jgi:hypothetical protein
MSLHRYRIYGLEVVANEPLPAMTPSEDRAEADVRIVFGERTRDTSSFARDLSPPGRRADGAQEHFLSVRADAAGRYWFRYADEVEFLIDVPARSISAWWPSHFSLEDAAVYLLGPILGFYLRLLGTVSLHASVFVSNGAAVALAGPAGGGKSTLIASLGRAGFTVMNEDVAPLRERPGGFVVLPGYPLIRLWPASVEHLFGSRDAMPQLTPSWDKRSWSRQQGGLRFGEEPVPLKAIYLLAAREDRAAPRIEALAPRDAMIGLVTNTYVNYLLSREQRGAEFGLLGRLVASIPVRRLVPHADITRLPELCDCVLRDAAALPG